MKRHLRWAVVLCAGSALAAPCASRGQVSSVPGSGWLEREREARLEYEIENGGLRLVVLGVTPEEIRSAAVAGTAVDPFTFAADGRDSKSLGAVLEVAGRSPGRDLELEVTLTSGRTLRRTVDRRELPVAATCTDAPPISGAVQCGSTVSAVGTPPYPCCDNTGNGRSTDAGDGNCTWLVWVKAKTVKGWKVPSTWGSAGNWCSRGGASPDWKLTTVPTKGTIACSATIGHVAWVESVSADGKSITVTEQNCRVAGTCVGTGTQTKTWDATHFRFLFCVAANGCV